MIEIKAPAQEQVNDKLVRCFLAGSIETGKAEDWQKKVKDSVSDEDVVLFNPRRDDWDSSWKQTIENDEFRTQVLWEITHILDESDFVFFYFAPDTLSPISLLELGMAKDKNCIVCCPEGFSRKGNIEVFCSVFQIPLVDNLDDAIILMKRYIQEINNVL